LAQRVEVIHGVIASAAERLSPPQQGAFAHLPRAGEHDYGMRFTRGLEQQR